MAKVENKAPITDEAGVVQGDGGVVDAVVTATDTPAASLWEQLPYPLLFVSATQCRPREQARSHRGKMKIPPTVQFSCGCGLARDSASTSDAFVGSPPAPTGLFAPQRQLFTPPSLPSNACTPSPGPC